MGEDASDNEVVTEEDVIEVEEVEVLEVEADPHATCAKADMGYGDVRVHPGANEESEGHDSGKDREESVRDEQEEEPEEFLSQGKGLQVHLNVR